MFENLTNRLNQVFDQLRRRGKLSEADVDAAMREVRLALLEADVHFSVVKSFIARVRERAIGAEVSKALNPGQQIIKIVNEELMETLGEPAPLNLRGPKPHVIMMVGLQGSGKTTGAGKLARMLRSKGERVLLVAGDPYRPAAVTQLQQLGERVDVPVEADLNLKPPDLVKRSFEKAEKGGYGIMIVDTAGRSQLDAELMNELKSIVDKVPPVEILLVVDSMIGQEALNIAQGFRDNVSITGLMMTKMDGDSRGGAAISIRSVTGVPIKFIGTGEKLDALETFDPARMSSRILGMGDMIGLIEKAEAAFDQEVAQKTADRMMKGQFTLEDEKNGASSADYGYAARAARAGGASGRPQRYRENLQAIRGDHQFDDTKGTPRSRYSQRLAPPAYRRGRRHGSAGCEPPHQTVPRNPEAHEDDAEDGWQRVGKVIRLKQEGHAQT